MHAIGFAYMCKSICVCIHLRARLTRVQNQHSSFQAASATRCEVMWLYLSVDKMIWRQMNITAECETRGCLHFTRKPLLVTGWVSAHVYFDASVFVTEVMKCCVQCALLFNIYNTLGYMNTNVHVCACDVYRWDSAPRYTCLEHEVCPFSQVPPTFILSNAPPVIVWSQYKEQPNGHALTKIAWQANQGVEFVSYMFLITGLLFTGSLTYACLMKHNETSSQYKVKRGRPHATCESSDLTYAIIGKSKFYMHDTPKNILYFDDPNSPLVKNFREKTCFSCIYGICSAFVFVS